MCNETENIIHEKNKDKSANGEGGNKSSSGGEDASGMKSKGETEEEKKKAAEDWTVHVAEGVVYYYNTKTGESTYDKPEGFTAEPEKLSENPEPVSEIGRTAILS